MRYPSFSSLSTPVSLLTYSICSLSLHSSQPPKGNRMLSPNSLVFFSALLLCLSLAIYFFTAVPPSFFNMPKGNRRSMLLSLPTHQNFKLKSFIFSSSLPHDDDSLLLLASRVKSKTIQPPKLAFLFLTTTPLPFAPLWETYFNHTSHHLFNIYIHADPTFQYQSPFTGVFANRVIHSKPADRYTPTLAAAARRLLAHALLDDPSNSMFLLLSPSCIPLRSFNFTYRTLTHSRKSFIEILKNESGTYDRWAARGPGAMLPEVKLEDFRIGSQFWVLTRKHARLVVSDRHIWPKFDQSCVRWDTCYPEENYFPTLLSMWDARGCVPATLTHVDWRGRGDGHPRKYEAWQVGSELIESLRKHAPRYGFVGYSGSDWSFSTRHDSFLFARKFSPDSLLPLMSISEDVIFKD